MTIVEGIPGFFLIPAGTKSSTCRLCGKGPIYWIDHVGKPSKKHPTGKESRLPIAIGTDPRAMVPTSETVGQGYSHFADCTHKHLLHREVSAASGRGPIETVGELDLMKALKESLSKEGGE